MKYRKRIGAILTNSINGLLIPMLNPLVAALVIRLASVELWGKFVNLMIIVQLGTHIVNWGNKDYLLRAFSRAPSQIHLAWSGALLARAWILAGFAIFLPLWIHSPAQWGLAVVWATGLTLSQSLDVFVQYRRDFGFALGVEMVTLGSLVGGVFIFSNELSVETLLLLFSGSSMLKAFILTFRYQEYIMLNHQGINPDYGFLIAALPFFLLGFSGMLQSRIDLYSVSLYFSETEVGKYQVLINFLLYLQAIANFILVPFVKNIYRLDYISIRKIAWRLFGFGILITPPAILAIYFVLKGVYHIEFSPGYFVAGGLYVLPLYYFSPIIYALFKAEQQKIVLALNFAGTAAVLGLNLFLLPRLGVLGAIVSVAIVHWGFLAVYVWQMRQIK